MTKQCAVFGLSNKTYLVHPLDGETLPAGAEYTSRREFPNYGSGAWFSAKSTSSCSCNNIHVTFGIPIVDFEVKDGKTIGDGVISFGTYGGLVTIGRQTMAGQVMERVNCTLFEISEPEYSGKYLYLKHRQGSSNGPWRDAGSSQLKNDAVDMLLSCRGIHIVSTTRRTTTAVNVQFFGGDLVYKLDELNCFNASELGIYSAPYAALWSAAYVDAASKVPSVAGNTLANLMEAVDLVKNAARALRDPLEAIKDIAQLGKDITDIRKLWLAYRYQYSTTKLDVEEWMEFLSRLKALASGWIKMRKQTFRCDGSASNGEIRVHCVFDVYIEDFLPKTLGEFLNWVSLAPTPSNLWDMIPYSFVVDWFLPIGEFINGIEDLGRTYTLKTQNIWFSATTSYDGQRVFFRIPGRRLESLPYVAEHKVSGRTIKMRVADAISLFT